MRRTMTMGIYQNHSKPKSINHIPIIRLTFNAVNISFIDAALQALKHHVFLQLVGGLMVNCWLRWLVEPIWKAMRFTMWVVLIAPATSWKHLLSIGFRLLSCSAPSCTSHRSVRVSAFSDHCSIKESHPIQLNLCMFQNLEKKSPEPRKKKIGYFPSILVV